MDVDDKEVQVPSNDGITDHSLLRFVSGELNLRDGDMYRTRQHSTRGIGANKYYYSANTDYWYQRTTTPSGRSVRYHAWKYRRADTKSGFGRTAIKDFTQAEMEAEWRRVKAIWESREPGGSVTSDVTAEQVRSLLELIAEKCVKHGASEELMEELASLGVVPAQVDTYYIEVQAPRGTSRSNVLQDFESANLRVVSLVDAGGASGNSQG